MKLRLAKVPRISDDASLAEFREKYNSLRTPNLLGLSDDQARQGYIYAYHMDVINRSIGFMWIVTFLLSVGMIMFGQPVSKFILRFDLTAYLFPWNGQLFYQLTSADYVAPPHSVEEITLLLATLSVASGAWLLWIIWVVVRELFRKDYFITGGSFAIFFLLAVFGWVIVAAGFTDEPSQWLAVISEPVALTVLKKLVSMDFAYMFTGLFIWGMFLRFRAHKRTYW